VSQGSGRGYCWYVFGRPCGPGSLSGLLYIYIDIKKGQVAISLCLHGELCIPVKTIQMVKKPLQLVCSLRSDNKGVINVMEPAQQFVGSLS